MSGSDIVICEVNSGVFKCTDMYGTGDTTPTADTQQDVTLTSSAYTAGSYIQFSFNRKLSTGDTHDNVITPNKAITAIYAVGTLSGSTYNTHTVRG